eukprot:gene9355-60410_t
MERPDKRKDSYMIERDPLFVPAFIAYLRSRADDGCLKTKEELRREMYRHAEHLGAPMKKCMWRSDFEDELRFY